MAMHNYLKAIINWAKLLGKKHKNVAQNNGLKGEFVLPDNIDFCHKDKVHIFVRGLADGKLHSAKNRNYSDCRFYKKENLKVFCAICRRRLL